MGKITTFVIGALAGACAALAFAPYSGEKTRSLVAEKATALAGEAKDFGAGLPGSATDALKNAQAMTSGLVGDASSKVKEVTGKGAEADSDELREKIEAARQRIAAQVMENAERAQEAEEATAEAVEEATAEAVEEADEKADDAKHAK